MTCAGRKKEQDDYAFYDDDTFIDLGTREQLAKKWNFSASTIRYMCSQVARDRGYKKLLYKIEEDDDD